MCLGWILAGDYQKHEFMTPIECSIKRDSKLHD